MRKPQHQRSTLCKAHCTTTKIHNYFTITIPTDPLVQIQAQNTARKQTWNYNAMKIQNAKRKDHRMTKNHPNISLEGSNITSKA